MSRSTSTLSVAAYNALVAATLSANVDIEQNTEFLNSLPADAPKAARANALSTVAAFTKANADRIERIRGILTYAIKNMEGEQLVKFAAMEGVSEDVVASYNMTRDNIRVNAIRSNIEKNVKEFAATMNGAKNIPDEVKSELINAHREKLEALLAK